MKGGGKEAGGGGGGGGRGSSVPIDSSPYPTVMLLVKTNEIMLEKTGVHRGFELFINI